MKNMKKVISSAFNAYFKNPQFLLVFVLEYLILSLFVFNSFIKFPNLYYEYAFLIFSGAILLLINSFFLSIFIGGSYLALKSKFSFKESFKFYRFTLGNFVLLLILTLGFAIRFYASSYAGYFADLKFSNLPFPSYYVSLFIFFIINLALIFLTFQNFYLTLKKEKIFYSVRKSFITVKKNYFTILLILVVYLALDFLISQIPYLYIGEIIRYVIVYPLLVLILTSLFENVQKT